jgi:hypothetical protein
MPEKIIELCVAFLLTTICGGMLGFVFQRRHARYQWLRSRWEKELDACQIVFEEISRLLDRRLYRARQLADSLASGQPDETKLLNYREVVTEWNDSINRLLALLAISFGDDIRNALDRDVGAEVVAVGRLLEQGVRRETQPDNDQLRTRIKNLAGKIYSFNLSLLKHIQTKRNELIKIA